MYQFKSSYFFSNPKFNSHSLVNSIGCKQIPTLEFNWMWIKDKKIYFNSIPYTQNHHIVVVDEDDEVCGFWLIERVERHERR